MDVITATDMQKERVLVKNVIIEKSRRVCDDILNSSNETSNYIATITLHKNTSKKV